MNKAFIERYYFKTEIMTEKMREKKNKLIDGESRNWFSKDEKKTGSGRSCVHFDSKI